MTANSAGDPPNRVFERHRSPLYPLLRTVAPAGELFIDLTGRAFTELSDGRG
jgi:hypothetical protein